ncbi:MAG: hypothetical protein PHR68_00975 [Candidatus Gracilibacteria bacterium]|nr:hypothetical protein [Candidatus Gracilibacteria bacterium]
MKNNIFHLFFKNTFANNFVLFIIPSHKKKEEILMNMIDDKKGSRKINIAAIALTIMGIALVCSQIFKIPS